LVNEFGFRETNQIAADAYQNAVGQDSIKKMIQTSMPTFEFLEEVCSAAPRTLLDDGLAALVAGGFGAAILKYVAIHGASAQDTKKYTALIENGPDRGGGMARRTCVRVWFRARRQYSAVSRRVWHPDRELLRL
jgi:hypothetical protein